jgi:hypothetical protein
VGFIEGPRGTFSDSFTTMVQIYGFTGERCA